MKIIGLTGGIGSGKSMITQYLIDQGIAVIDADQLSRDIVKPSTPGLKKIAESFGQEYLLDDGELDRAKMGELVFKDKEKLSLLNSLLHPILRAEIKREIECFRSKGHTLVILDAAILIESKMQDLVDEIWLVYADQETQIERIMKRDGFTRAQVIARIGSQMPIEEKKKHADIIIDNNQSPEKTIEQVKKIVSAAESN